MRRLLPILLAAALAGTFAHAASAGSAPTTFVGGTAHERATVQAALNASSFDWSLLPQPIEVSIGNYGTSYATYGEVFLDAHLLDAGVFSWGVVQHEFGHQVDFFLLDDAKRALLLKDLGGLDWCYGVPGLAHSDYGCERFASELSWAYWPSSENSMAPTPGDPESDGMPIAAFRALLSQLIGAPDAAPASPPTTKAFAPATAKPKAKRKAR